ncbi:DUF262 domain-containing protein [Desulfofundulus thermosubterraneus]|uniref:DUF262 domain-containing protein n=1 Tax=Desulfofundulus thermosubterraneus DSM 16057 TaxID=1121432 RepID=A0A1M6BD35_9FIRM|nr:DUF262 domain-containing protein [Desulfofundulus thermosubterraneus]SHI46606.1 Protein of unknown function [Desulfofundulus thermosubterraneus DSM 16057]
MSKIEAREIFVKDLFSDKFLFQIPVYQRPFSWDKDDFDNLFEDIRQSMENGEQNYFLGSIILRTVEKEADGSGLYDLVDGQQRITSLIILLAVMRDLLNNFDRNYAEQIQSLLYQKAAPLLGKKESFRLLVWEREQDFFKENILQEGKTLHDFNLKTLKDAKYKMVLAITIFKQKFINDNGEINKDLLFKMSYYVLNNCLFAYVKTGELTLAFRLFTVLNTRGLPLTASDLLKSYNLAAVPDDNRKKYAQIWENIEDELGKEELERLISFLRDIFIREKAKRTMFEEFEERVFASGVISKGEAFIKYLKNMADIYRERVQNAQISSTSNVYVRYYNLMSLMRDFIPSKDWMSAFLRFCEKFNNENKIMEFLQKIEKRYIVDWVLGFTPTQRLTIIYNIIRLINESTCEDEVINNSLFDTSAREKEFLSAIDSVDFYDKNYSKYVLLRIDLDLSENQNITKAYKGTITIEHILPRNPSHNEWLDLFDKQARSEWTNKIGNLVLLSRRKNSSANNRPFLEKKKSYFGGSMTDFELTKEIDKYNKWDIQSIQDRQREMLRRAKKLWL